jgi:hypothetical protein
MMLLTSTLSLWHNLAAVFIFPASATAKKYVSKHTSVPGHSNESRHAEQDVLCDMIWSNPEAFSSELDFYYRMHLCRGGH